MEDSKRENCISGNKWNNGDAIKKDRQQERKDRKQVINNLDENRREEK